MSYDVFFTSDLHGWHKNILSFQPNRTQATVEDMNDAIIEQINKQVRPTDALYMLGDICFGGKEKIKNFISRLNGKKHLILGNHDYHLANPKNSDLVSLFESVSQMKMKKIGKQHITMCHYPILHWAWKDTGSWMLHGHLHGHPYGVEVQGRIKDVGVDTRTAEEGYKVYSLEELELIMDAIPLPSGHHSHQ